MTWRICNPPAGGPSPDDLLEQAAYDRGYVAGRRDAYAEAADDYPRWSGADDSVVPWLRARAERAGK